MVAKPLKHKRYHVAACALPSAEGGVASRLVVVGGYEDGEDLAVCEELAPGDGGWQLLPEMKQRVSCAAACMCGALPFPFAPSFSPAFPL